MSLHHRLRTAAGSPSDPYWSNTSLLLLGNGTNGGQNNTFIDSSSNNFTITRYGNVTQGSFSPFTIATGSEYSTGTNGGSGYFDGSGDYLTISDTGNVMDIGANDFTFEAWVYRTAAVSAALLARRISASVYGGYSFGIEADGSVALVGDDNNTGGWAILLYNSSVKVPLNAWTHVACTRSGSTWKTWVNGQQAETGTASITLNNPTSTVGIGAIGSGEAPVSGFVSSMRLIIGSCQYSSAFTPPSTPLTAITNTKLLLNFTNASILDSTGKNDIETVGDAQISTSVKKYGTGSLKFDGTGDYLITPNRSDHNFGTSDFTVECWFYMAGNASPAPDGSRHGTIVANMGASGIYTTPGFNLVILGNSSTTGTGIAFDNRVTTSTQYSIFGYTTISQNTWHHCAVVRSGTTTTIYLNGVSLASGTLTDQNISSTNSLSVGRLMAAGGWNFEFNGYIDDLRITKGVARYTANFTPPTRQLPAR